MAQASDKSLADEIAVGRTIIAKLDHAARNDSPPNFGSEILVRVHKEATSFEELADATSEELRKGQPPNPTTLFSIYTAFRDLYDEYDEFVNITSKRIELAGVRSVATAREYAEVKAYLEAETLLEMSKLNDQVQGCKTAQPK